MSLWVSLKIPMSQARRDQQTSKTSLVRCGPDSCHDIVYNFVTASHIQSMLNSKQSQYSVVDFLVV